MMLNSIPYLGCVVRYRLIVIIVTLLLFIIIIIISIDIISITFILLFHFDCECRELLAGIVDSLDSNLWSPDITDHNIDPLVSFFLNHNTERTVLRTLSSAGKIGQCSRH